MPLNLECQYGFKSGDGRFPYLPTSKCKEDYKPQGLRMITVQQYRP
jgi:hypothetical protein